MSEAVAVEVSPVTAQDVRRVGSFLHDNLNQRVPAHAWAASVVPPWPVEAPNHGFMLTVGEQVVGVYLAFYSDRTIAGNTEKFCNLGAWCVLDGYRSHGLRLVRALLGQRGYHFTDLSPSGNVVALNHRLKFANLDTSTALMPNLPWPFRSRRARVVSDPATIAALLEGDDLVIFRDHAQASAAVHLVVTVEDEHCYVIVRKDRRKDLPVFASVLYVGNAAILRRAMPVFRGYLLRRGLLATLAETRVLGFRPRPSVMLSAPRPKMFRSATLRPSDIDYLYSELTCVAW